MALYEKEFEKSKSLVNNQDKAWEWFKSSVWDVLIAVTIFVYIATGLIDIQETGRTFWEILATGAMAFIFGMTLTLLFNKKGLIKGTMHPTVLRTNEEHEVAYRSVLPHITHGDVWCEIENTAALKLVRERILSKAALNYKDYFDEEARSLDNDLSFPKNATKLHKKRILTKRKAVKDAINAKITYLTISELISSGENAMDPNYLGRSKQDYDKSTFINNAIGRLIPAIIVGYFTVNMLENASIAQFIWTAFQALIFVIMGYLKYLNSFYFIVDEDRMNNKKRIAYLNKFLDWVKKEVNEDGNRINSGSTSGTERVAIQPTTTSNDTTSAAISNGAESTAQPEPISSETGLSTSETPSTGGLLPTQ